MSGMLPGESSHQVQGGSEDSGYSRNSLDRQPEEVGRWYFSRKEIEESAPSRRDGIDLKKETYFRKSYCTFLQDLGMRLKVIRPQGSGHFCEFPFFPSTFLSTKSMSVPLTRFSWWLWGSKEKEAVSNGSSLSNSSEWGSGVRETDSVKFPSKLASSRKVKKRWQSREERGVERERDVVFVPRDGGVYLSGSESEGPDWSIGWVEPHGSDFRSDDESDDGFAVLVPCYRPGCKEFVETSSDQLLSAIKNLPDEFSSAQLKPRRRSLAGNGGHGRR